MSHNTLDHVTKPIAEYYSSITPSNSAALQSYLSSRTAVLFSMLSTTSFLTFSLGLTLFRSQWQRLFTYRQKIFRRTSGRFKHIVESNQADHEKTEASYLYLASFEFRELVALARETMHQADAHPSNYTTLCTPSSTPRAYSDILSPQYADFNLKLFLFVFHAYIQF